MDTAILERLAALGIRLLTPDAKTHYMFARDNFVALVERREDGMINIGSTGIFIESGLAYLVWRDDRAWFAAKGSEIAAGAEQVAALRRFSSDLEQAIRGE